MNVADKPLDLTLSSSASSDLSMDNRSKSRPSSEAENNTRLGGPNPRLDVLQRPDFNAGYRFPLSQIQGGDTLFAPVALPFARSKIVAALQPVDQGLVTSGSVLVVRQRFEAQLPFVLDFQDAVRHHGRSVCAPNRPGQQVCGFGDLNGAE